MASIDQLIQDFLAPVEHQAARLAPKVLGWLDNPGRDSSATAWDWFDGSTAEAASEQALEITELQMPMDVVCALFGLRHSTPSGLRLA